MKFPKKTQKIIGSENSKYVQKNLRIYSRVRTFPVKLILKILLYILGMSFENP